MRPILLAITAFAALVSAKTDLQGCTSSQVIVYGGASLLFWVPGTGEVCSFLDCGGGRAPPKTTVPGCGGYTGTETVTPTFLSNFPGKAVSTSTGKASSVQHTTNTIIASVITISSTTASPGPITSQPSATTGPETLLATTTSSGVSSISKTSTTAAGLASATNNASGNLSPGFVLSGSLGTLGAVMALLI